jgi:hypothetical protein
MCLDEGRQYMPTIQAGENRSGAFGGRGGGPGRITGPAACAFNPGDSVRIWRNRSLIRAYTKIIFVSDGRHATNLARETSNFALARKLPESAGVA